MQWKYTSLTLRWQQGEEKDLGDLGTVCICLHPPTMQQLLYLLLVPIQKVLCQMQVQIFTVIIQMGLKVLFSVEKRQMVAFLSKNNRSTETSIVLKRIGTF